MGSVCGHRCEHVGLLKLSLPASCTIADSLCRKSFADKRQCHSCQDWFAPYGSEKAVSDPMGPAQGRGRVVRGGSFNAVARSARLANRYYSFPVNGYNYLGFRLSRTYR